MTNSKRRTLAAIALTLGLVALMLIAILTALHAVGTDAVLYYSEQTKAGVLPEAGISEADLRDLDGRLAAYLAGDEAALNAGGTVVQMPVFDRLQPAFNEREMTHMGDCFRLFQLLRKVRSRLVPWAVLLIVGGAYLLQNRRMARLAAWLSPLILLIPLGAFGIWAAADFDGAFSFLDMFMAMGLRIAAWSLAALIAIPALATLITFIWPKNKQDEANSWNDNRATRRASAQRPKTFDFGEKR